jgi:hypothetical protein
MIETLLVLGCIIFFILLAISFQERSIMYKDYPTSCDVTYIPKKENIYMLGPSNFNSSPYNFKTKDFRKLELENLSISELKAEIFKEEYTEETIEDIYSTRYGDFSDMRKDQLIDIILDIESDSFKKDISPDNYESDTFLDKILL